MPGHITCSAPREGGGSRKFNTSLGRFSRYRRRNSAGAQDPLSSTAKPSTTDTFQARYAIRHPWTGPVTCERPARGRWGGPPANATNAGPTPAKDLAHTERVAISLASYVKAGLDDAASVDKAAADAPIGKPKEPVVEPKQRACHCAMAGSDRSSAGGTLAVATAALAFVRRRRVSRR